MEVWMIWASAPDGALRLLDAWDAPSAQGDPNGWEDSLIEARAGILYEDIRVVKTTIDLKALVAAFEPPTISNRGTAADIDALAQERARIINSLVALKDKIPQGTHSGEHQRRGVSRSIKIVEGD